MGDWWDEDYDPYDTGEDEEEEETAWSDPSTPDPPEEEGPLGGDWKPEGDSGQDHTTPKPPATPPTNTEPEEPEEPPPPPNPHDSDPNNPNTVDYEPIYDETGKITGYEMYVDGVLKQTFDYSDLYDRLEQIEKPGTFQDYLTGIGADYQDATQSAAYQAMQELTDLMNDPNRTAEDMALAAQQTATRLGYGSVDEMMQDISRIRERYTAGVEGQQGLTDAERKAFDRQTQATIRNQQKNAMRMLDQVLSGATNNSTRNALLMANDYISQIRDTEINANMQMLQLNAERQLQQFDANRELFNDLIQRGEITQEQVLNALYQNRMGAMQGYAQQVATILQQNDQYLNMYQADLDRIRLASEQVYNGIQSELNINADMRDAISESFAQYWAELMAPLNYETAQLEQEELRNEQRNRGLRTGLGILGIIAGICLLFVPGAQVAGATLIGTGIGTAAGG